MKYVNSILIIAILFTIYSCSDNPTELIDIEPSVNMHAGKGISDSFGVYIGNAEFVVNIPASGDYHLQYKTETDSFDLIFNVRDSALILIGLDSLDKVQSAALTEIIISNSSTEPLQGTQVSESVILYYVTGNIIPWNNIVQKPGSSILILIDEGNELPGDEVIILEEENIYPKEPICFGEHTLVNSYSAFECQISNGFNAVAGGGYWIRMSIGFDQENGEAEARAARPDISLPVTMNGVSLSMADTTVVEYNQPAGFWEVNAYYCTGILTAGEYIIVGESYNKGEYIDRATCILTVK